MKKNVRYKSLESFPCLTIKIYPDSEIAYILTGNENKGPLFFKKQTEMNIHVDILSYFSHTGTCNIKLNIKKIGYYISFLAMKYRNRKKKFNLISSFFRQRKEAERIEMLAKNALNTSLEAKRLAEETLAMPDEADREIQMLRQKYDQLSSKMQ